MTQTARFDADADVNTLISQLVVPVFTANIWRSAWVRTDQHRRLTVLLEMNQASAADGVLVEQSLNDVTVAPTADADAQDYTEDSTEQRTNPVTGVVKHHSAMTIERIGLWARVVVKHAGVAPTTFKCKLIGNGIT